MRSHEDGSEELYLTEQHIYGSARLGMRKPDLLLATYDKNTDATLQNPYIDLTCSARVLGEKEYELTNHLGNVLAVVSDKRLPNDEPDVVSVSDYYPYGMLMPDRNYDAEEYRYGFNGKEDINELNGWQDYGERMYSPLSARFQSPDPIIAYGQQYPELSSYQFASNTPIWGVDLDGLEVRVYTEVTGLFGHTFLTVQKEGNVIVYTYGRYAGGDKNKSSANSTSPTGPGVLVRLIGKEAHNFIKDELVNKRARVFEILDADEKKVIDFFEYVLNSTNEKPSEGKYIDDTEESKSRIIDTYNLLNNNCTTKTIDAIEAAGSDIFDWELNPIDPAGTQEKLKRKDLWDKNVKEVTYKVKEEINIK